MKREFWIETAGGDSWRELAESKQEAWAQARRQVLSNPGCHQLAVGWSAAVEITAGEMSDDNDYVRGSVFVGETVDEEPWDADAMEVEEPDDDGEWPTPVNLSRGSW